MKANHVSTQVRLRMRIAALETKLDGCWTRTDSRFYQFCRHCDRDNISVNMNGHGRGCAVAGVEAEILHYKSLLTNCASTEAL